MQDRIHSISSWSPAFRHALKNEEFEEFQLLLSGLQVKTISPTSDSRVWSMDHSRTFSVKSLTKFLNASSPLDKHIHQAHWKSKSPKRINILVWIMLFGTLNCAATLQQELQAHALSPICPLCHAAAEDLQHLIFVCPYSSACWWKWFSFFQISWVFSSCFKDNILSVFNGPSLSNIQRSQSLLSELCFERNQSLPQ